MNYREKIRKAIECPQFGNSAYGEWGALRLDQRKNIKRLLDEMDRADEFIKHQYFEIERLKADYNEMKDNFRTANDEISRLNNIINELEKWLEDDDEYAMVNFECGRCFNYKDVVNKIYKLKELKEGKE